MHGKVNFETGKSISSLPHFARPEKSLTHFSPKPFSEILRTSSLHHRSRRNVTLDFLRHSDGRYFKSHARRHCISFYGTLGHLEGGGGPTDSEQLLRLPTAAGPSSLLLVWFFWGGEGSRPEARKGGVA